jgi:transcriptional regulator with XRE-family HTH domain
MTEGKKLRALRVKLNLSQKQLANLIGMQSWIPAWEAGRCAPPRFVWVAMAKLEAQKRSQKTGFAR